MATFNVTATDTGLTITTAAPKRFIARAQPTTTGLNLSDSLKVRATRSITDTGLALTESLAYGREIRDDIGLTITDSLRVNNPHRSITDTGLTVSDSLGQIELSDAGLVLTDSLARQRIAARSLTDTAVTVTDSTQKVARKVIADTGLTITADLVARKNGGNVSVNLTSVGLTLASSLAKSAHLFRGIPGSFAVPDRAVTITDGIRVTSTPPGPRPRHPHANFTDNVAGLTVAFTDTSTPGSSGPITAWFWTFGDGGTSTAQNPSHTYAGSGTYTVTLTVTGTSPDGFASVAKYVTTFVPAATGFHIDAVLV